MNPVKRFVVAKSCQQKLTLKVEKLLGASNPTFCRSTLFDNEPSPFPPNRRFDDLQVIPCSRIPCPCFKLRASKLQG